MAEQLTLWEDAMDSTRQNPVTGLTDSQIERLVLLTEECAEVIHGVSKILRHGFESRYHTKPYPTNREALEQEIAQVLFAIELMNKRGDISLDTIFEHRDHVDNRKAPFIHFQGEL